jgi:hypothetical protein
VLQNYDKKNIHSKNISGWNNSLQKEYKDFPKSNQQKFTPNCPKTLQKTAFLNVAYKIK